MNRKRAVAGGSSDVTGGDVGKSHCVAAQSSVPRD